MTFVSALFSRTHFIANCFAVLNESFKVISLFSYQSSLFVVFATAFIFYQKHLSLSTTFLFFFIVFLSDSLFILSPAISFVNNFFSCCFFLTAQLYYHVFKCLSTTFFIFYNCERRRRDLNPRAAVNDLHPFQGCPFGQLGYFSELK